MTNMFSGEVAFRLPTFVFSTLVFSTSGSSRPLVLSTLKDGGPGPTPGNKRVPGARGQAREPALACRAALGSGLALGQKSGVTLDRKAELPWTYPRPRSGGQSRARSLALGRRPGEVRRAAVPCSLPCPALPCALLPGPRTWRAWADEKKKKGCPRAVPGAPLGPGEATWGLRRAELPWTGKQSCLCLWPVAAAVRSACGLRGEFGGRESIF